MRQLVAELQSRPTAVGTDGGVTMESALDKAEIYRLRKKHFSGALSISYENTEPLLIVRGQQQYLYDEAGTSYLDTRNNVRAALAAPDDRFTLRPVLAGMSPVPHMCFPSC
jgi:hypothetical protein